MKLPVGVSDFKKVVEGNYQFVDKSLLIKEIMEDGSEVITITRPRRFGKSLNLSMLYYFLQSNFLQEEGLFDGLAISEDKEFCQLHQNKYPVIFVSFKSVKRESFDEAFADIKRLMAELYDQHRYLLEGDFLPDDQKTTFMAILNKEANNNHVESAVEQLSKYLEKKFNKKVLILIDDYDIPIQESYLRGYYLKMVELIYGIIERATKDNIHIIKGIITGTTPVSSIRSSFGAGDNFSFYSLLNRRCSQYFGFTEEEEVIKLMHNFSIEVSHESLKAWYNGYQAAGYVLYNPCSMINCLKNNGELKLYRPSNSTNDLIARSVDKSKSSIKGDFDLLLQGKIIEKPILENFAFPELDKREEAIWSLLFYTGYLKVLSSEFRGYLLMAKFAIPNKEVSFIFDKLKMNG